MPVVDHLFGELDVGKGKVIGRSSLGDWTCDAGKDNLRESKSIRNVGRVKGCNLNGHLSVAVDGRLTAKISWKSRDHRVHLIRPESCSFLVDSLGEKEPPGSLEVGIAKDGRYLLVPTRQGGIRLLAQGTDSGANSKVSLPVPKGLESA